MCEENSQCIEFQLEVKNFCILKPKFGRDFPNLKLLGIILN